MVPRDPLVQSRCTKEQPYARANFTITAEILARSLANFYGQYADRHKFEVYGTRQPARERNSTIYYRKKQIYVSF